MCLISGACLALGRVVTEHPKLSCDPSANVHTAALQTSSDTKHSVCCVYSGIRRVFFYPDACNSSQMDGCHPQTHYRVLYVYNSVFTQLSLAIAERFLCMRTTQAATLTLFAEMPSAPVIFLTFFFPVMVMCPSLRCTAQSESRGGCGWRIPSTTTFITQSISSFRRNRLVYTK